MYPTASLQHKWCWPTLPQGRCQSPTSPGHISSLFRTESTISILGADTNVDSESIRDTTWDGNKEDDTYPESKSFKVISIQFDGRFSGVSQVLLRNTTLRAGYNLWWSLLKWISHSIELIKMSLKNPRCTITAYWTCWKQQYFEGKSQNVQYFLKQENAY